MDENQTRKLKTYGPYCTYRDLLFRGNCLSTSATVVRRTRLGEVAGFSPDRRFMGAEDYELWLRLAQRGCSFHYLHQPLGIYYLHGGAFSSKIELHCQNILNVLEHHFAPWKRKNIYYLYSMQRRRALTIRGAAHTLLKNGARLQATHFSLRALHHDPFSLKSWVLLALALVGAKI